MDKLDTPSTVPVKTGHPIGFWFFFWGELAERCSYYGMRTILTLYLTVELGLGKSTGLSYFYIFAAACYLLPLAGGFIADNFLGKYLTIVSFSIPYVAGQFMIAYSKEFEFLLLPSLVLLAMGTGVIKPNISTLMGLTYDQQRPGQDALRSAAFSWFYMAINIGAFMSQFLLPPIRDAFGYKKAFMIPGFLMMLALLIFALGKPYYAHEVIERRKSTPIERALKWKTLKQIGGLFLVVVFFWAVFDQSSATWTLYAEEYMNRDLYVDMSFLPLVGDNFVFREVPPDMIQSLNPLFIVILTPLMLIMWKVLAKKGIKLPPTSRMLVGFFLTASTYGVMSASAFTVGNEQKVQEISFGKNIILLPQGDLTENKQKPVVTENGTGMLKMGDATLVITGGGKKEDSKITFTDGELQLKGGTLYFEKGALNFEKSKGLFPEGIIELQGTKSSQFANATYPLDNNKQLRISAWEVKYEPKEIPKEAQPKLSEKEQKEVDERKITVGIADFVPKNQRCGMWWMVLCFFILTVAELLISVTGLELAFVVAPPSMKSFVTACWLLTVFIANMFLNTPLANLYPKMHPKWYFLLMAGLGVGVTVVFLFVARRFDRAMAENAALAKTAIIEAEINETRSEEV